MDSLTLRALLGSATTFAILCVLIFVSAGTLDYWQGWLYWAVFAVVTSAITVYFLRNDRGLIERRMAFGPVAEPERAQRGIQSLAFVLFCALMIVPGLDRRFGWSHVPWALVLAGDLGVALGFWIVFLVFKENQYAASLVRVEEGQRVISTGPYAYVRHPMYLGALLLFAGTALALGSWWALAIVPALKLVLVARLLDEERRLSADLPGYDAYRRNVRYRLVPRVW